MHSSKAKPGPQTAVPVNKLAYTIPEAAVLMSMKVSAVRTAIHKDKLKFVVSGNSHVIPHAAILEFLENEARTYKAA
jgi:excisionase family DNA binding protein